MKDIWYGDRRDLVKWSALAHLASREGLRHIVQIPFLRKEQRPQLHIARGNRTETVNISKAVWEFFQDVTLIKNLGLELGQHEIQVFLNDFHPSHREQYIIDAAQFIREIAGCKVVLLDPDTGIEPGKAKPEHVKVSEIRAIWEVLETKDWLVVYQHALHSTGWQEQQAAGFKNACATSAIEYLSSPHAADVVFYAAGKSL